MIWHSIPLMTTIDILIILGTMIAGQQFYKNMEVLEKLQVLRPITLMLIGLICIALFYITDLYTMFVLPLFIPMTLAMEIMRDLHLNFRWVVSLAGEIFIIAGLFILLRTLFPRMVTAQSQLRDRRDQLEQLVQERTANLEATNQKLQQEVALSKRKSRILESTSDLVCWATPEGNIVYINQAGKKMLNWSENEDLTGKTISDTQPPWAMDIITNQGIPTAIKDGRWQGETAFFTSDGREIPVAQTIMSHKSPDGEVEFISTIARDISARQQAEEALRSSEDKWRSITQNSPNHIMLLDRDAKILFINYTTEDLTEDQVLGKSIYDFIPPDYLETVRRNISRTLKTGNTGFYETKHITTTGDIRYFDARVGPVREGEQIVGAIISAADVTERKRIDNAMKKSEQRFRSLFNTMKSGVAIYEVFNDGEDFIFKDLNTAGEKISNVNKADIIGQRVSQAFPGIKEFGLFEIFQQVHKTGQPAHHPVTFYLDDKLQAWLENHVYKLESGEIVAIYDDLTTEKQAEAGLRLAQFSVENTNDALFWIAPDARIININKAACTSLGYSREELLTMSAPDFDTEFSPETWPPHFARLRENGHATINSFHKTKEGTIFPIEINTNYFQHENREYIFASARDMTERKQMETNLRTSEEEAHRANQAKSEFLANMSRLRCLQHIDTKQKILKPKKRLPHKIHRKPVTELAFALPR